MTETSRIISSFAIHKCWDEPGSNVTGKNIRVPIWKEVNLNTNQIVWISSRCFQIRFRCKCWLPVAFVEPITSPRKTMKNASSDCVMKLQTSLSTGPHPILKVMPAGCLAKKRILKDFVSWCFFQNRNQTTALFPFKYFPQLLS